MKKQHLKRIEKLRTLQILGGITDPNLDPDAGYVIPVKDPTPIDAPDEPVNEEPDPSVPRSNSTI